MDTTLWILQILLAAAFVMTGGAKLLRPRLALAARMPFVVDFSDVQIKAVGFLEVVAAAGLTVAPLLGVGRFITPLAALGLVAIMLGAAYTHWRRHEPQSIAVNAILLLIAAFVAWGRFGPYSF